MNKKFPASKPQFAVRPTLHYIQIEVRDRAEARPYKLFLPMTISNTWVCDGCGQSASAEHIARRLQRLEWATRYRPVHINALLLGAISPLRDEDFLYASGGEFGREFHGEAAQILDAVGISIARKTRDAVNAEFQRAGYFLTHVLECPLEEGSPQENAYAALRERLAAVATRIRRSLKPKRVMAVTEELMPVLDDILALDLGCPVLLDRGKPFRLEICAGENGVARFREALASPTGD